jgi:hypothetical protein
VVFLAPTLLVFTPLPFARALFDSVPVAGAFDAAACIAVPGSATAPEVAGPDATALPVVAFLDGAFGVVVFATVAVRAAVFLAFAPRLEAGVSLGFVVPVAVSAAFGSASAARCPPGLRPGVAFLAAGFGFLVAPLALVPKASATTASASSNVS